MAVPKYRFTPGGVAKFDKRLLFTTFPYPAPHPSELNGSSCPVAPLEDGGSPLPGAKAGAADQYYFFTIDNDLVYLSFFSDFGPLNCAHLYRFCVLLHDLLKDPHLASCKLVLYSSDDPHAKANAALLMALYTLIVMRRSPSDAFYPIAEMEFVPFRDAGRGRSDFCLSISDCLWGMHKAIKLGLLRMEKFDLEEYEYYEKVENGDWNWLTPNFVAFASPLDPAYVRRSAAASSSPSVPAPASPALTRRLPATFTAALDYFTAHNVQLVVRLNNALYDARTWTDRGVRHVDLYFDDGTNPSEDIVREFIALCEEVIERGGVIAVHCKAGLGRTGTLIGAYLIYKHGFTANEVIAFLRIMRPGSVVGPQQQYMYQKQFDWVRWGVLDAARREAALGLHLAPQSVRPVTPPSEEHLAAISTPTHPSTPKRIGHAEAVAPVGQPRKTPAPAHRLTRKRSASLGMHKKKESTGSDAAMSTGSRSGTPSSARGTPELSPARPVLTATTMTTTKTTTTRYSVRLTAATPARPTSAAPRTLVHPATVSRIPTALVPAKRGYTPAPAPSAKLLSAGAGAGAGAHTWIDAPSGGAEKAAAAGAAGGGSARAGLPRSIRRRRSSLGDADVVA